MSKDAFGDRMKLYERAEAGRAALPLLPICARLDGRNFSGFTKDLKRPYDERFHSCMLSTAAYLVEETNARVAYTQSDEISLVFMVDDYKSQIFFNGKFQKMVSVLASLATVKFNSLLPERMEEKAGYMPVFDCRVWTVPNAVEACNAVLWREHDATKNSISMAARAYYSHKQLHNKSGPEMQEMLFQKEVNWNDYPFWFKRGTYVRRIKVNRRLTEQERMKIPEKFRPKPEDKVERTSVISEELPPLTTVENREDVLFRGVKPVLAHG